MSQERSTIVSISLPLKRRNSGSQNLSLKVFTIFWLFLAVCGNFQLDKYKWVVLENGMQETGLLKPFADLEPFTL